MQKYSSCTCDRLELVRSSCTVFAFVIGRNDVPQNLQESRSSVRRSRLVGRPRRDGAESGVMKREEGREWDRKMGKSRPCAYPHL